MFTTPEIRLLSNPYFQLIRLTDNLAEIKSKPTVHYWVIKKTTRSHSAHLIASQTF